MNTVPSNSNTATLQLSAAAAQKANGRIVVPNPNADIDEKVDLIRRVCAPNATNSELELLCYTAKKYNLDPLLNEIWLIKTDSRTLIKVARDGYLKIAHASGQFDGMSSQIVQDQSGRTVKAVCEVYRKDMSRPFRYEAFMEDFFNPKSQAWQKSPTAMLVKVAESHALKRAFSIHGVVGDDYDPELYNDEVKQASATGVQSDASSTANAQPSTANAQGAVGAVKGVKGEREKEPTASPIASEEELQLLRAKLMRLPIHRREKALKTLEVTKPITRDLVNYYSGYCDTLFIATEIAEVIRKEATEKGKLDELLARYGVKDVADLTTDIVREVQKFLQE